MSFYNLFLKFFIALFISLLVACGGGGDDDDSDPDGTVDNSTSFEVTMHSGKQVVQMILPNRLDVDSEVAFEDDFEEEVTNKLYETFQDNFDFIVLVSNNSTTPDGVGYAGVFTGLGAPSIFGSAGRLQGIVHFPKRNGIRNGPALHEIGHNWTGHKGFFCYSASNNADIHADGDGRGPLGGCSGDTLAPEAGSSFAGGGTFTADSFGRVANGGNGIPYNGEELFEMGFITKAQAGDIWVPVNPEFVSTSGGKTTFTADSITKMTYAAFNTTDPDNPVNNAQLFRILTVLIDNEEPSAAELQELADDVAWFTSTVDNGDADGLFNFYEATNQLGTLEAGPLDLDM